MCKEYSKDNIKINIEKLSFLSVNKYKVNVLYNNRLLYSVKSAEKQDAIQKFNSLINHYKK